MAPLLLHRWLPAAKLTVKNQCLATVKNQCLATVKNQCLGKLVQFLTPEQDQSRHHLALVEALEAISSKEVSAKEASWTLLARLTFMLPEARHLQLLIASALIHLHLLDGGRRVLKQLGKPACSSNWRQKGSTSTTPRGLTTVTAVAGLMAWELPCRAARMHCFAAVRFCGLAVFTSH